MKIWHLIAREISHRRLNFALGVAAIAIAAGCLVGAQTMLSADQMTTEEILDTKHQQVADAIKEKEAIAAQAGKELEDEIRKHMKGLGFNVLVLPQDQDLAELHLNGALSATMPEEYVDRLANSSIVTVNHLLPAVTKRIQWDTFDTEVILYGTRGEVPIMHRGLKKPLLDAVAPGHMVVGHTIHTKLGLEVGDTVTLKGKQFQISKLHPERGSADDVTIWIDLKQAQEILGLENLVHAILALECECAGDRISEIRAEIAGILPGTQVIERYSRALARAEARAKAKEVAVAAVAQEKTSGQQLLQNEVEGREKLEAQHAAVANTLVPLVILVAAGLVGFLAFTNARQRREEIGILRALGLRTPQIFAMFLGKAVLLGLLGGILGCTAGLLVGLNLGGSIPSGGASTLLNSGAVLTTLATTPLLAVVMAAAASWAAALFAARQDAALVLQGD